MALATRMKSVWPDHRRPYQFPEHERADL